MDSVEKAFQSYKAGIIPKENVQLEMYQCFSADVKVQDVRKCERERRLARGKIEQQSKLAKRREEKAVHVETEAIDLSDSN